MIYDTLLGCSIIAQERLNRITEFVNEVSLSVTDFSPSCLKPDGTMNDVDSADEEYGNMASECSVDSILTAAASGVVTDDEIPSALLKVSSPRSPESVTASEASDLGQLRDIDKCSIKILQDFDDNISEASECRSEAFEKLYDSGQTSPEIGTFVCSRGRPLERIGSSQSLFRLSIKMKIIHVVTRTILHIICGFVFLAFGFHVLLHDSFNSHLVPYQTQLQ